MDKPAKKRKPKSQDEKQERQLKVKRKEFEKECSFFLHRARRDTAFWLSAPCKELREFVSYVKAPIDAIYNIGGLPPIFFA